MFNIKKHGVDIPRGQLSPAQQRLLNEPSPVRICGSPTGGGKTYAFIQAARQGQAVLFIVPTIALSKDILHKADSEKITCFDWSSMGTSDWDSRQSQVKAIEQGGLIVATLEALAAIVHGIPKLNRAQLAILNTLSRLDHVVFDEAHTLNERAFGLVHLLATIIIFWYQKDRRHPKLSLLSATHSTLFADLVAPQYLSLFDEQLTQNYQRPIHGEVSVTLEEDELITVIKNQAPALINQGHKLLIIYDAIHQLSRDEPQLGRIFKDQCGLDSTSIIAIDGQDRQAERSLGGEFEAGIEPKPRHQVIIGTAAIEMGVNFKDFNHLITEQGVDAAAWLQRLGRVAREDVNGGVIVAAPRRIFSHFNQLKTLTGDIDINELRQKLAPLRQFNMQRAQTLGSAYWLMLNQTERSLMRGVKTAFARLAEQEPPKSLLNKLLHVAYSEAPEHKWRQKRAFKQWLDEVMRALKDVRGFSPTVKVQFADSPEVTCSRDWVNKWLMPPTDALDTVYRYPKPRDYYLLDKPNPIGYICYSPVGVISFEVKNNSLLNTYLKNVQAQAGLHQNKAWFKDALAFIQRSGLVIEAKE